MRFLVICLLFACDDSGPSADPIEAAAPDARLIDAQPVDLGPDAQPVDLGPDAAPDAAPALDATPDALADQAVDA